MRNTVICLLIFVLPLLAGCNRPKDIPEDKLEDIVYEVFLANAYADMNSSIFIKDTLDIYTPILKKYGYKPADIKYTIQNYSKRKSVSFASVLEKVALRLEAETGVYKSRLALRDSVDNILAERYRTEVYRNDSLKIFRKPSNPEIPDLKIDVMPGRYVIEFSYYADTIPRGLSIQYRHYLENEDGSRTSYLSRIYRRGEWVNEKVETTVNPKAVSPARTLNINFAQAVIREQDRNLPFRVEIDSVSIWHYLPVQDARDRFIDELIPFLDIEELMITYDGPEVIIPLRPDTARTVAAGGD